jgi:hypothetical protein
MNEKQLSEQESTPKIDNKKIAGYIFLMIVGLFLLLYILSYSYVKQTSLR